MTFSSVRRMYLILMRSNAALTEEDLRQLGGGGLGRMIVGNDGQTEEIIFTLPLIFANMATS